MNCMEEDRQREIFEKLLNNPIPGILFCMHQTAKLCKCRSMSYSNIQKGGSQFI